MEFEVAYQTRVAIDRIKLAVKQTEGAEGRDDRIHEAGLLLLDALDRLQSVERRFQQRSRHMATWDGKNGIGRPMDRLASERSITKPADRIHQLEAIDGNTP